MFFESTIFFVLKNKKQKMIFNHQTYFSILFYILDNRKLFSRTVTQQVVISWKMGTWNELLFLR